MKKVILIMAAALIFAACGKDNEEVIPTNSEEKVHFTFECNADWETNVIPMKGTKGLTADGKQMTDFWVFDYMNGTLVQQMHQTDTTEIGTVEIDLSYGSHSIYFVASRGANPVVNTVDQTITWGTVRDTYWKAYDLNVTPSTNNGTRTVNMDRIVSKLKMIITDEMPSDASTLTLTPAVWYYGCNYTTGAPVGVQNNLAITTNVSANSIGQTNNSIAVYGFSAIAEWLTNVSLVATSTTNTTIGSVTVEDVPIKRNMITEVSGPLFTDDGGFSITLNSSWDSTYHGTW